MPMKVRLMKFKLFPSTKVQDGWEGRYYKSLAEYSMGQKAFFLFIQVYASQLGVKRALIYDCIIRESPISNKEILRMSEKMQEQGWR